jgi:hypothetical protein
MLIGKSERRLSEINKKFGVRAWLVKVAQDRGQ